MLHSPSDDLSGRRNGDLVGTLLVEVVEALKLSPPEVDTGRVGGTAATTMEDCALSEPKEPPALRVGPSDDGVTIVELLIALTIVMIAFAALASTVIASFAAIRHNETRVTATAIANQAIEDMTTMPWRQLGLYEGDDTLPSFVTDPDPAEGEEPVFEGELVVLLEGVDGAPPHLDDDPDGSGGRDFTVTRWVTFVEEDDGSDLKRMVAIVSWDDGNRSVRVEGLRAPDPIDLLELQIENVTALLKDEPAEDRVPLRRPGHDDHAQQFRNEDAFVIRVEVGLLSSSLTLTFRDREGELRVKTAPDIPNDVDEPEIREFTIGKHEFRFPHGPVPFLVTATSPDGHIASDTVTVRFYQPLKVVEGGDPVVEDENWEAAVLVDGQPANIIQLDPDTCQPIEPVTIRAEVWGMTANEASDVNEEGEVDALVATWHGPGPDAPTPGLQLTQVVPTREGGLYRVDIAPGEPAFAEVEFHVGEYEFLIEAKRGLGDDGTAPYDAEDVAVAVPSPVLFEVSDDAPDGACTTP